MVRWRLAQLLVVTVAFAHTSQAANETLNSTASVPIQRRLQDGNTAPGNVAACYAPFHNNEYPLFGGTVNLVALRAAIDDDFRIMSKYFTHVRTYYAQHFGIEVAPIAAKYGLKLYLGVFLTSESWWNDEANAAAKAIKQYSNTVEVVLTGNENLAGFYQRSWDILYKINDIKARAGSAVGNVKYGTVQRINEFVDPRFDWDMQQLNDNLDILGVNIYPFFTNSYDGNRQVDLLDAQWNQVTSKFPRDKIRLTETGFPTAGSPSSLSPNVWPSVDAASKYYQGVVDWTPSGYETYPKFWFQVFDRRHGDPSAGGQDFELSFGFLTTQKSLKREGYPRPVNSASVVRSPARSAVCSIEEEMDYSGLDIGSKQAMQAENCFGICATVSGCGAFTWNSYNGGTCWLKASKGVASGKNGARSGVACAGTATPCAMEEGTDYSGSDLASKKAAQAESCFEICASVSGCQAFTWTSYNGGTCWLKSSKGSASPNSVARSGTACTGDTAAVTSSTCAIEEHIDYSGSDVGNKPATQAEHCFGICNAVAGCGAFTWTTYNGGTCWLKASKGNAGGKNGARSGVACKCNLGGLEVGVDYAGVDLTNGRGANAEACISMCQNTQGCRAFTWTLYNGGTCWLKAGKGSASAKSGTTSGVIC